MKRLVRLAALLALFLAPLTASADIGDNEVGMNVHDGRQPFIDACVDLGVGWIRVDANWYQLEPSDDSYNWSNLDQAVQAANAAGLQVYMTLAYTPAWVPAGGDTDGETLNDIPNTSTEWEDFVTDAVNHYRAMGVTHFGMWNEPNLDHFFEGTPEQYVDRIAIPGAAAVRAACNDCLVLGPDLAHVSDVDDQLEAILSRAPLSTFDILAHHIYGGFPETGTQVYDGDRFFNALDQQRFPFTRRSMKQVLDKVGYTGEVWITETGFEAENIGDAQDEADQATYVELVLDEQLKRGWYTNTFFYEIHDCGPDQPNCTIDGFGLMRATSGTPGNRSFPNDFRLKPAFTALKQKIANTPSFQGGGPPQCGDGVDNDGDGRIDLDDRGCTDGADDDESDDPPRKRLTAFATNGITIDGELDDFGDDGWVELTDQDWRGTEALGIFDLNAEIAARWDSSGLYLGVKVIDDVHENDATEENLWQADSVQLAFDVGQSGGDGYDDVDDHEINLGLSGGQTATHRFHGPAGATDDFDAAVVRDGTNTYYEIHLGSGALPSLTLADGTVAGFSFLVNDADGQGRVGWLEWTRGIGNGKSPAYFGEVALDTMTAGGDDTGTSGDDMGTGADMGSGVDAGTQMGDDGGTTGTEDDGGVGRDGGLDRPGDSDGAGADDGCGCDSSGGFGGTLAPILLLCVALVVSRRRRLTRRQSPRDVA